MTENDPTDTDAFEAKNFQTYGLTHAANLSFFPFLQNKTQLILIKPGDFGR